MAQDRVEAVERALSILEAFGETRAELTLTEIAEETGLYKSTILRLAASLGRYGYLVRDDRGLFRLGPGLWRLGSSYRRNFDLDEFIRPVLRELVNETGETASFSVRDGDERVCLYRENSRHPIRHHLDEGVRLPLERGAAGRVLLAHAESSGSENQIIRDGFAISVGERSPDVAAVAVPVRRADGAIRGALAISGLASRFDAAAREIALPVLQKAAQSMSGWLKDGGAEGS